VQKQNTEHALMTEADTDRSLQLVLDQGDGTPSGEQQCWPTSMYCMLCYQRWKCIRHSSTTVTTSSEPSLSCGSNAGMLQWNHPRLHWMHTQYAMHLCIHTPIHTAAGARHFTDHHCHARAFLFHSQTVKDIPSVINGRWAADIIGADLRTCANDTNRTWRSRWQVRFNWTTQA